MQNFFEWFRVEKHADPRPWLILGKGPSFSKRVDYDLAQFNTLSLNHAFREQPVLLAHMIDLDVVDACCDVIDANAKFLVLPWYPHVDNSPGQRNLGELVEIHPVLNRVDQQGRLLWYNASNAPAREGTSPVVQVRFFSVEAAVNLLAQAGVSKIRSLGIDGGARYSSEFDDLKDKTLLANSRMSFDEQFEEIAKTILRTRLDYAPLNIESPIRVYVGSTEAQMLAVKVLEYSIRKHTSVTVEVSPLHLSGIDIPLPKDVKNHPRTPFSFQRFLIPALKGHKGRAIYLDSDMQVFKDIRALWTLPFNGADLLATREPRHTGRRPQFSVMLLNCEALCWNINDIASPLDQGNLSYEELVYKMKIAENISANIDPMWNSLERYHVGETALLHYTDMDTQPWVSKDNPLGYLWMRDLFEAIDNGHISMNFIREQLGKGYIRPSLLYQIERRIEDSLLLLREAKILDKEFSAPYWSHPQHNASPWVTRTASTKAALKRMFGKSTIYRARRMIRARWGV